MTVASPLTADRVNGAATTPGHTLTQVYDEKCRRYYNACEREGIKFVPLPIETLGGWHPLAADHIRRIARASARCTGKEEDEAVRHLFQRLAVLLVKGNAAMLIHRVPAFPPPSVDGDI